MYTSEHLRFKDLAQGPTGGSLVVVGFELTTSCSEMQWHFYNCSNTTVIADT